MSRYGTTTEQIAVGAAKNHCNAVANPNAHYRFELTSDQVLADRSLVDPLTRAMCAPMTDGAAAVTLCSERYLATSNSAQQDWAVRNSGIRLSGDNYRCLEEPSLTEAAARRTYARAGIRPQDVDVAEVHDATSFCEA